MLVDDFPNRRTLISACLFLIPVAAMAQTQPCGPDVSCDDCSDQSLGDLINEELQELFEKFEEFFMFDNLVNLGSDSATGEVLDQIGDVLEANGTPEEQAIFEEHRSDLESFLSDNLEAFIRAVLGVEVLDASKNPTLSAPLPSDTDQLNFAGPDATGFQIDDFGPVIEFDAPSFGETLDLLDSLADGDSDSVRDDLLSRFDRLGLALEGSAGTDWRFELAGGVSDPFVSPAPFGEFDLKYDNGDGFNLGLEFEYEDDEWRAELGLSWQFSQCTCCQFIPLLDCNSNGVHDALDIANGFSHDVNLNDVPDECEVNTVACFLAGTADGGFVALTIEGFFGACTVTVPTVGGESASVVVANLAMVVNADACLVVQEITAEASGTLLSITGFTLALDDLTLAISDTGLEQEVPPIKIPTLSTKGILFMVLVMAALGVLILRRSSKATPGPHCSPR